MNFQRMVHVDDGNQIKIKTIKWSFTNTDWRRLARLRVYDIKPAKINSTNHSPLPVSSSSLSVFSSGNISGLSQKTSSTNTKDKTSFIHSVKFIVQCWKRTGLANSFDCRRRFCTFPRSFNKKILPDRKN